MISKEILEIDKKLVKCQILGFPGWVLIGLGLYGLFGADGNAFLALLNEQTVCYGIIFIGSLIAIWEVNTFLSLLKEKRRLSNDSNQQ